MTQRILFIVLFFACAIAFDGSASAQIVVGGGPGVEEPVKPSVDFSNLNAYVNGVKKGEVGSFLFGDLTEVKSSFTVHNPTDKPIVFRVRYEIDGVQVSVTSDITLPANASTTFERYAFENPTDKPWRILQEVIFNEFPAAHKSVRFLPKIGGGFGGL